LLELPNNKKSFNLNEAVGDFSTYKPEQQGPLTGAFKYWTGLRTGADVAEARKEAERETAFKWAQKLRQATADKDKANVSAAASAAKKAAGEISGSEAAGIAAKKGFTSAGEALGGASKKVAELAGEHPGLVAGATGLGLGALLMKRRRQQQ